jgi:protein O-GlcNAc transferase
MIPGPQYKDARAAMQVAQQQHQNGNLNEAVRTCFDVLSREPKNAEALHLLGLIALQSGRLDMAIDFMRQSIAVAPQVAHFHTNLGAALQKKGRLNESIAEYRQAIALDPRQVQAYSNLGAVYHDLGLLDDALESLNHAIKLNPDYISPQYNLGVILSQQGDLNAAIEAYRQVLQVKPDFSEAHSSLVYALHFHPAYDAEMIYNEHRNWNELHAKPLARLIQPHTNNRDANRQLRIGYVSPDFRDHSVGRFLLPLLGSHDPERFAITCYSDVLNPDRITEVLQRQTEQWRNVVGTTDDQLAQMIRDDQIDILVDLTMHMARNRMLVFARKPAPVQTTYLAYCSTTGLETMDYRLTDPYLDPPGMNDAFYSEKSIRLPETYWCYPVHKDIPDGGPPPASKHGEITFGCLNNFCKISAETLEVWANLLKSLPKSRLILHAPEGNHRHRVLAFLQDHGAEPNRLSFAGKATIHDYFLRYREIDIGLDPFPCNGGTTTCDALWMGVPVITLAGRTAVGRAGVSILNNIGLPELIANSRDEYVQIAAELAADFPRLTALRSTLRERMRQSALMDPVRFTRNVEAAYRQMWRNWCQQPSHSR